MKNTSRKTLRQNRHRRVRRKITGTSERPRMAISVSNKNMQVQFIDDETAKTVASASTQKDEANNLSVASDLGKRAAELASGAGVKNVVVDRGGHKFHGKVKAIVDAVAEAGLLGAVEDKEAK